jgi:CelD/BcsL family acetyltransferase involved in cellulose biosynthesis
MMSGFAVATKTTPGALPLVRPKWTEVTTSKVSDQPVHSFHPLQDARWNDFVERHPRASVFHSSPWLEALRRTYGYDPIAYTTSQAGGDLENAIVFCRVNSWLTGRRLVSLPFSDHCAPLAEPPEIAAIMARTLDQEFQQHRWRYVEMRPLQAIPLQTTLHRTTVQYAFHELDLEPNLETLFRNLHKDSTQRKIRRAEREGLTYREGSDAELLDQFYKLFQLTRERHRVPPQPRKWFAHLMEGFGDALKIRVAYKGDQPIASMLTLRHKDTLIYKYGCSDRQFNNLGSMHFLYWRSIEEAKNAGLRWFDFGRTDADQQGLITFKNRWGGRQSVLTYSRYGVAESSTHFFDLSTAKWKSRAAKRVMSLLPSRVVSKIGQILYGHVG